MTLASTTIINSDPSGARVYLNGEKVGSTNTLLLKKESYQDFSALFSRNEDVSVGAIVGGIFVLVPLFWVMDYKPTHSYEMVPLKSVTNQ